MYTLTSQNQSMLESAVKRAVEKHEGHPHYTKAYIRFLYFENYDASYPDLCVKYHKRKQKSKAEYSMLKYLYSLTCEDGDTAPHVPEPVHHFSDSRWEYIVMRRIAVLKVSEPELHMKTANALHWLHSKELPPGVVFGPIGDFARHRIFNERKAPFIFTSIGAVEGYLNRAISMITQRWEFGTLVDLAFSNEKLILTQCDMAARNFGVALDGRPVLFDAFTIQAMPPILVNFTMLKSSAFSVAVSKILYDDRERAELLISETMESLVEVANYMVTKTDDTLGLDQDGNYVGNDQSFN